MIELRSSMIMVDQTLPPLSMLRVFAVAGRLESFRDAAAELGVTPSAVSHQIAALEALVGAPLFERAVRRVQLTPRGRQLSAEVNLALSIMARGFEEAQLQSQQTTLKVSALSMFTNSWLVPRLSRFEAQHPAVSLAFETTNRVVDLDEDGIDVAIRNVTQPTQGLVARKLIDLRAVPLCAPSLATSLRSPADLANATLIHLTSGTAGWPEWLAAVGVPGLRGRSSRSFDTMPSALEAAAQGQGVVLGLAPLVWDAAVADRLVVPFATPSVSAGTFFVVHRRADRARPLVRAFVDWLTAEMATDRRRLAKRDAQRSIPAIRAE